MNEAESTRDDFFIDMESPVSPRSISASLVRKRRLHWTQLRFVEEGLVIRLKGNTGELCLVDRFRWAENDVEEMEMQSEEEEGESVG
jgi:hypothetical protein